MSGNFFTDNPVGAEFQSGTIDLTGAGNIFTNGNVGLRFAPFDLGGGLFAAMTLVNDGNPAYGGTIGAQSFTGFTDPAKRYVELANGAFYNPGTPTLLNGLNSTYDVNGLPFRPADAGGVLTQEQFDWLEQRFYHYPDGLLALPTAEYLGLFWFGGVPNNAALGPDIDQRLIFNRFGAFNGDATGLNVQITGLPAIPGGVPAPTAANFNNIVPFAGGTDAASLNQIETAAGGDAASPSGGATTTQTAQTLNAVVTESGGDERCWGNAAAAAGSGQVVNVVYGGSMADNLDQAEACGTSF